MYNSPGLSYVFLVAAVANTTLKRVKILHASQRHQTFDVYLARHRYLQITGELLGKKRIPGLRDGRLGKFQVLRRCNLDPAMRVVMRVVEMRLSEQSHLIHVISGTRKERPSLISRFLPYPAVQAILNPPSNIEDPFLASLFD